MYEKRTMKLVEIALRRRAGTRSQRLKLYNLSYLGVRD
jgi:hypothetical protein